MEEVVKKGPVVLVCGGRYYNNYPVVEWWLNDIGPSKIIQGGANGADKLARKWAWDNKVDCTTFHPDWERFGRHAGPIRNLQMLKEGSPDMVLALPGGKGTEHMVRSATEAKIPVTRVKP